MTDTALGAGSQYELDIKMMEDEADKAGLIVTDHVAEDIYIVWSSGVQVYVGDSAFCAAFLQGWNARGWVE